MKRFPYHVLLLPLLLMLGSCGDQVVDPGDPRPQIEVAGVDEGETYHEPVTVSVEVDRGSFTATLNGAPVQLPARIDRPGDYVLAVEARSGTSVSTKVISFALEVAGESILLIRILDLGDPGIGGGGDAVLLSDSSAAGHHSVVIDAGPQGAGESIHSYSYVAQHLVTHQITELEFLQLTHAHADHYLGLPSILNDQRIRVRRFLYNGQVRSLASYQEVLAAAAQRADSVIQVRMAVLSYTLGTGSTSTSVEVLPPLTSYLGQDTNDGWALNEGSLGTRVSRGSFSMFFTGDGEYEANHRWRTQFSDFTRSVTALKVGHHGANNAVFDSGTSGPSTWLTHTSPRIAVISASGRTHPRVRALNRLHQQTRLQVYCTNVHGTVEIRVAPSGLHEVRVARNPTADCVPGSEAST